ncbi:MAG: hypothetical protein AB7K09_15905 [Planctomycetota bacterium]
MLPRPSIVRTFASMQTIGITLGVLGLAVAGICGGFAIGFHVYETRRHEIIDRGQRVVVQVVSVEERRSMGRRQMQDPYVVTGEYTTPAGATIRVERRIEVSVASALEQRLARGERPEEVGNWHPDYPDTLIVQDWEVNYDRAPAFAMGAAAGGGLVVIGLLAAMSFASHVRSATPVRGRVSPAGVVFLSPGGIQREMRTRKHLRRNDPVVLLFDTGRAVLAQSVYGAADEERIASGLPQLL